MRIFLQICTFYQKGVCAYGTRCRYDHIKVSRLQSPAFSSSTDVSSNKELTSEAAILGSSVSTGTSVEHSASDLPVHPPSRPVWGENSGHCDTLQGDDDLAEFRDVDPADQPICSFAAAGECPHGVSCRRIHGDLCPTCRKHCLHPFRPQEREEHMSTCEKRQKHLEALTHSQEIECSVCLEKILSKPTAAERKFGILSECDHPFCVSCIRNWRSTSRASGMDANSALRSCPICRKLSYFVIPSVIWYSSKEDKQEIVESYKSKLRYSRASSLLYCFLLFLTLMRNYLPDLLTASTLTSGMGPAHLGLVAFTRYMHLLLFDTELFLHCSDGSFL